MTVDKLETEVGLLRLGQADVVLSNLVTLASLPPPLPADQVRERIPWPWPCLIIHGENDRLVSPMLARQIVRQLEDAGVAVTLSLYPAGHAPFIEEPERFNRELVTFLEERLSSASVPARSLS